MQFTNAVLFKPLESGPTNTPAFKLAPLLLREAANSNSAIASPVVFFAESKVSLKGRSHDQVTFVWRPIGPAENGKINTGWQGLRITLNASGWPVIWETLADDSGGELIFVSQSLELAARQAFGPPHAGRRFAIESSLGRAPDTLVARVIEDGPVPMGPIVHLFADSHNVSTLICRCMSPQAKNLLATQTYELRPLAESEWRPGFDKAGEDAAARLTRALRVPAF